VAHTLPEGVHERCTTAAASTPRPCGGGTAPVGRPGTIPPPGSVTPPHYHHPPHRRQRGAG